MLSPEPIWSGPAAADYSATTARFVTIDTSGNVATVATAQAHMAGVMYNAPASGKEARVDGLVGLHRIEAGSGGLALGAKVASDNAGKGITASGNGAFFAGICTKAAEAGEVAQFFAAPGSLAG